MEKAFLSIGQKVPDFSAITTMGPIKMSDYKGKWVVFFSHPGDFTPVCTTEFIAFATMAEEFEALNAKLLGISIDSNPSHLAWVQGIYKDSGVTIPFPIIADRVGEIARLYGMVADDVSKTETVRNVFIIDPEQRIRAILIYPLTNGRNIPEILRLLTALQTSDKYNVVTPANWEPGEAVLVPAPKDYANLMERENNAAALNLDCEDWWWCYKYIGGDK